jgi:hypothetical protein
VIQRDHSSGLVVAELGMDGGAIELELKRRDPLLALQGWASVEWGCILWRVVRDVGADRPPETVLVWMNPRSGEPYPLSSGLLDELDRHDRNNTRRDYKDTDRLNVEREARVVRQQERDNEALRDDWLMKHGRPVLPRSQSLRMARDKRRAKGEKC